MLDRGSQHERLERRSCLASAPPASRHRVVPLVARVVAATDHRLDAAIRVERHERGQRIVRAVERVRDRVPRVLLHVEIERRVDAQTATEQLGFGEPVLLQLLHDIVAEVFRPDVSALHGAEPFAVGRARLDGLADDERGLVGLIEPRLIDLLHLHQVLQHAVSSSQRGVDLLRIRSIGRLR